MGDLKSIVLHDMKAIHIKSTFPCSLGTRVTGVDDKTYSSTGEAFSTIGVTYVLPCPYPPRPERFSCLVRSTSPG